MSPLPFNMHVMEFLASHRTPFLTHFFLAVSAFGDFYTVIITLIYVAWNKKLAIRFAVLMSLTSSLNILLKLIIRNPRPFVLEGTYLQKWAVTPQAAKSLATQFSTPSGHAMAASSFYSYLFAVTRKWYFRAFAIAAIVLIGISRPYLGVHYVEDVLLGWASGLCCALLAIRYSPAASEQWSRLAYPSQIGIAVAFSLAMWLLSIAVNGGSALGQPSEIKIHGTAVIVAGGMDTATALPTARALRDAGNFVVFIEGARNREMVLFEDELRKAVSETHILTDDNSYGERGPVTNKLNELIANGRKIDYVLAVGSIGMMRAVAAITAPRGIKTTVSLKTIMMDGAGMCGGCRELLGNQSKFACVDGHEFDAAQVNFEVLMQRNAMYRDKECQSLRDFKEHEQEELAELRAEIAAREKDLAELEIAAPSMQEKHYV